MYGSSQFTYLLSSKSGEFRYFIVWLIRFQHLYCKILRGLLATINSTFIKAHCSFFHHSLHVSHVAHSLSSVIPEFLNFLVQLPGIIIRHFASRDIIYQIGQFLAYLMPISLRIDKNTGYAIIQHQTVILVADGIESVFCQTFSKWIESTNENDIGFSQLAIWLILL